MNFELWLQKIVDFLVAAGVDLPGADILCSRHRCPAFEKKSADSENDC